MQAAQRTTRARPGLAGGMAMEEVGKVVFEYGQVLLKMDRSKRESAQIIRTLGGDEQEQVLQQHIAKYWNPRSLWDRPDGLLVVTDQRVVFLTKQETIATTTDFLSLPLEFIENLRTARVWLFVPAIRFEVRGMPFAFTLLHGAGAVCAAIASARERPRAIP
ncbi:MAG: hypothetical protein KBH93_02900 [Anaerolineae bacterium]|nr:hypothetical protein [Anaerolineae bacterium]